MIKLPKAKCWNCGQIIQTDEIDAGIVGCELFYLDHIDEDGEPCKASGRIIQYSLVINENENISTN